MADYPWLSKTKSYRSAKMNDELYYFPFFMFENTIDFYVSH